MGGEYLAEAYLKYRPTLLRMASKRYMNYSEDMVHDSYVALKTATDNGRLQIESVTHARFLFSKQIWRYSSNNEPHKTKWYRVSSTPLIDDCDTINPLNSARYAEALRILHERISGYIAYDRHRNVNHSLTEINKQYIRMYFKGYSQAEIAGKFNTTESTVRTVIFRVKKYINFNEIKQYLNNE